MPDQVIKPYDMCLTDFSKAEKDQWVDMVHQQLVDRWTDQAIYTILAGGEYRSALRHMPMVEDVIGCWTQWRMDRGMTRKRARMSIGLILQALKEDRGFY